MIAAGRKNVWRCGATNLTSLVNSRIKISSVNAAHFSDFFLGDPSRLRYKQVGNQLKEIPETIRVIQKVDFLQLKLEVKAIFNERVISQTKFDRFIRERLASCGLQVFSICSLNVSL